MQRGAHTNFCNYKVILSGHTYASDMLRIFLGNTIKYYKYGITIDHVPMIKIYILFISSLLMAFHFGGAFDIIAV